MMNRSLFFLIYLLLISSTTHAQMDLERLQDWVQKRNLEFRLPEGYEEVQLKDTRRFNNRISHKILNREKDIIIGLFSFPYLGPVPDEDLEFYLKLRKAADPETKMTLADFRPNNLWKMEVNANIDTTIGPPLPVEDSCRVGLLRADTVVIFPIKIDEPYQGRYTHGKHVIMNRNDGGYISLRYFYHEDNAHLVDDEIERTWGMLKFRADSLQEPTAVQRTSEINEAPTMSYRQGSTFLPNGTKALLYDGYVVSCLYCTRPNVGY